MCSSWFIILIYNILYGKDMEDVNFSNLKISNFYVHEGLLKYMYIYIYTGCFRRNLQYFGK